MLNKQYTSMLQEKDVIFEIFQYAPNEQKLSEQRTFMISVLEILPYLHLLL